MFGSIGTTFQKAVKTAPVKTRISQKDLQVGGKDIALSEHRAIDRGFRLRQDGIVFRERRGDHLG